MNSSVAYLTKQDKMAYHKTITTVYDNETNTHWEVGDGDTVESIREVINSFKQTAESDEKAMTDQKRMNKYADSIRKSAHGRAMDTVNKAAINIMASGTEEDLFKHMCLDDDGNAISYSEMRSRFG
jgi:type II secretory pathway component GspD/PulD (secretin)